MSNPIMPCEKTAMDALDGMDQFFSYLELLYKWTRARHARLCQTRGRTLTGVTGVSRTQSLKNCSVVRLPFWKPAFFSAMMFLPWGYPSLQDDTGFYFGGLSNQTGADETVLAVEYCLSWETL